MNSLHIQSSKEGFSLVELLVVISIIGILVAIVYANFGDARAQARDDTRKTDLKQLQLAIELYRAQNGRYPERCPVSSGSWSGEAGTNYACSSGNEYIIGLVPDFIAALPTDSNSGSSRSFIYNVRNDGTSYKLMAHNLVENKLVTSYDDPFARCPQSFGSSYCGDSGPPARTYAVYSAGAESW